MPELTDEEIREIRDRLDSLEGRFPKNADARARSQEGHLHRRISGWISTVEASADITLTTSNADVTGATITLPRIGKYAIDAVFDFEFTALPTSPTDAAAVGVLTDSGDNEIDTPRAAIKLVPSIDDHDGSRQTSPQIWDVVTTQADTVYKLRARISADPGSTTVKVLGGCHTVIRAQYVGI